VVVVYHLQTEASSPAEGVQPCVQSHSACSEYGKFSVTPQGLRILPRSWHVESKLQYRQSSWEVHASQPELDEQLDDDANAQTAITRAAAKGNVGMNMTETELDPL
jgi:hypothetical protein